MEETLACRSLLANFVGENKKDWAKERFELGEVTKKTYLIT